MPFCVGCGVRVEPGVERCPACEARAAASRGCPRCGAPLAGQQSRFCVTCGAPLAPTAGPAAPTPVRAPSAPPQQGAAAPGRPAAAPDRKAVIESTQRERAAVYQRLGRLLLGACYEGKLPYDQLPEEMARQTRAGIQSIRKGHAALAAAGVCPRCLETTLAGDPPTCSRCRWVVPVSGPEKH